MQLQAIGSRVAGASLHKSEKRGCKFLARRLKRVAQVPPLTPPRSGSQAFRRFTPNNKAPTEFGQRLRPLAIAAWANAVRMRRNPACV